MITINLILMIVLVAIVLGILYKIISIIAKKFGLDAEWLLVIWLIILLIAVIWAFGLFGVSQPIVK